MISYLNNCNSCSQQINCRIMPDLIKMANMENFKHMDYEVQVHCKMYKNSGYVSSCSTECYPPSEEPKVVTNCEKQCGFYKYCLKPIYVNDMTALQIEAVKWELPITLTAMCRCLIKKEDNTDGNN